ncbi:MAG: alanine racemase, partial [Elusimicrobiales bacterium]
MLKWIEIDTSAIANNIRLIKNKLGKTMLMAVVKADGYGHGAVRISQIAQREKVEMLGVINCDEGAILRENKIKMPIMILAPSIEEEIPLITKNNLIPTVDRIEFAKKLSNYVQRKIKINIDIDTGLKRWGVDIKNIYEFIKRIKKLKNIEIFSISTHIAYTPYRNMVEAKEKLEMFSKITYEIKKENPNIKIHVANSLLFLDFPDSYLDMVRIGNLIYGIYPSDVYLKKENSPLKMGIKRPWRFFARIVSIKEVRKGESFGYASEIVATSDMKIATLEVG